MATYELYVEDSLLVSEEAFSNDIIYLDGEDVVVVNDVATGWNKFIQIAVEDVVTVSDDGRNKYIYLSAIDVLQVGETFHQSPAYTEASDAVHVEESTRVSPIYVQTNDALIVRESVVLSRSINIGVTDVLHIDIDRASRVRDVSADDEITCQDQAYPKSEFHDELPIRVSEEATVQVVRRGKDRVTVSETVGLNKRLNRGVTDQLVVLDTATCYVVEDVCGLKGYGAT